MIDHVWIASPPGYAFHRVFDEVAEAFASALGCDVVYEKPAGGRSLVFGAHTMKLKDLNPSDVIYQSEQISPECDWVTFEYQDMLVRHEVWDYSVENIKAMKSVSMGGNSHWVPIRYMPCMTKFENAPVQDIDVLFCGSTNGRRCAILSALEKKRVNVVRLFGKFGAERDDFISRAKVVLNIHYSKNGVFEIFRCAHLFANKKCVISECGRDTLLERAHEDSAIWTDYDGLVMKTLEVLEDEAARKSQELRAFESFSRTLLSGVVSNAVKNKVF